MTDFTNDFTSETYWDLDEITGLVEDGKRIEEAIQTWKTSEKYGDLVKLVRLTSRNDKYLDRLHEVLKKQYGNRITVYRGGILPAKGYTSVTSSRFAALRFAEWRGRKLTQFSLDTDKVLAAITTVEQELIARVMDLT